MATVSCGRKAIMLSCGVSECNNRIQTTSYPTTKHAEFYLIFLALCFHLFWNIFGYSTLVNVNDCFGLLWELLGISLWSQCFPSQNNFTVASPAQNWKKDFSMQKYLNRFDLYIMKTLKKNFILFFQKRAFYYSHQW